VRPAGGGAGIDRDILETVLGASTRGRHTGRLPVAATAALVAHASLLLALPHAALAPRRAADTARPQPPQAFDIDIAAVQPPVSKRGDRAPPSAGPGSAPPKARDIRAPRAPVSGTAVAQAATVVTQQPDPGAPLYLTGDVVVTGAAKQYAGGLTASAGTSRSVLPGKPSPGTPGPALPSAAPDRSSPVSLESENWSCPWPPEADAQQVDEQRVMLRVIVDAQGVAEAVTVLFDPGHGFGPAAVACAKQTRFTPARNRSGEPVRSTSPPIRVRFTR
jgi:periplasmic protein TonB